MGCTLGIPILSERMLLKRLHRERRSKCRFYGQVDASASIESLEATIRNLTDFNNALHQLLPKKSESTLFQAVACALARDNEKDELDNLITAAATLQYVDVAKLARFKKAYQMLDLEEEQKTSRPPELSCSLQIDERRVQLSTRHATRERTLANLDNDTRVIIEWKSYHPSMLSGSHTARQILRSRVSHLAELMSSRTQKPDGFNILTCAGYFDQSSSEHFGFAFDYPNNVVRHMPFTLHELIASSSTPALGTRFKIALSLSRTLNLLHSSGWLHKSIRSNNVAIFQSVRNNEPEYERPFLLGLGYSRPDGYDEETFLEQSAVASTNQLYRHPEVQGPHPRRYSASDDIYSLGLVLLEIALWMPLARVEGRKDTADAHMPLNIEKIKSAVSSLPKRVGNVYKVVVEHCLKIDEGKRASTETLSPSASEWNVKRLRNQNMFCWDVVQKLEECRA